MKYNEDVMEVHNEFITAGETLLKKAEEILKTEVNINPAKIERLKSFGFKSSKDATALEDDKAEKTHQQKLIEAINYYRVKFPNYKFIPQDAVKVICEKYGLVSGEAHQYKGFVPEKNLIEIERFFEAYPDMRYDFYRNPQPGDGLIASVYGKVKITKDEYDEVLSKQERKEEVTEIQTVTKRAVQSFKRGMDMDIYERPAMSYMPNYFLPQYTAYIDPYVFDNNKGVGVVTVGRRAGHTADYEEALFKMAQYYGINGIGQKDYNVTISKKEKTLRICAPIADMNTSGYELKDGYKLVYDPIVSIEVTHKNGISGEIILTAWGDEASDELVIDQNKN